MTPADTIVEAFQAGRSMASVAALLGLPLPIVEDAIRARLVEVRAADDDVCPQCDGTGEVRRGPEIVECEECAP